MQSQQTDSVCSFTAYVVHLSFSTQEESNDTNHNIAQYGV